MGTKINQQNEVHFFIQLFILSKSIKGTEKLRIEYEVELYFESINRVDNSVISVTSIFELISTKSESITQLYPL